MRKTKKKIELKTQQLTVKAKPFPSNFWYLPSSSSQLAQVHHTCVSWSKHISGFYFKSNHQPEFKPLKLTSYRKSKVGREKVRDGPSHAEGLAKKISNNSIASNEKLHHRKFTKTSINKFCRNNNWKIIEKIN